MMMVILALWTLGQQQAPARAVQFDYASPPIDFSAMPTAGSTDVPVNVQVLLPLPNATPADQFSIVLLDDDDGEVGANQEVQRLSHDCVDGALVRIKPMLPLSQQSSYRVLVDRLDDELPAFEVTSFVTGNATDTDAPNPPNADPLDQQTPCGTTLTISHEPQTIVTSLGLDGSWNGLAIGTEMIVASSGPAAVGVVAIDLAGNMSLPALVDVSVPIDGQNGGGCGGCHQSSSPLPWLSLLLMFGSLWTRRRP